MRRTLVVATLCLAGLMLVSCANPGEESVSPDSAVALRTAQPTENGAVTSAAPSGLPPGVPGGGAPAQEPTVVAAGKRIDTVSVAPPKTYAVFDLPAQFSGAEFVLIGRPYGWVPSQAGAVSRRLILRVDESKGMSGQTEKFVDLTGRNALVWVDSSTGGADGLVEGGTYRIEATVRPTGETGALYAKSVERTD